MELVTPEVLRQVRLEQSKTIELLGGRLKIRIAPCLANHGFALVEKDTKTAAGKAELFLGSCIDEKGDPLFKTVKDVEKLLGMLNLAEAGALITEMVAMNGAPPGNSEGSPSVN